MTQNKMTKISCLIIYIFIFYFIPVSFSKPEEKNEPNYKCDPNVHNVQVGEDITLCIHIVSEKKKLAMPIKVDEYSMVSFNHIYNLIKNKEIELIAQIGDTFTSTPTVRS